MTESGHYINVLVKDAKGQYVQADFDDIKDKAEQYEVEMSYGPYDY
jgi:hypothetical protein